MELHGKVVSPSRTGLNLNGNPEILVNTKSGRITLSNSVTTKLDNDNLAIGFGYDPAKEQGSKAFMYVTEEGCKVGKGGTVSNKWHSSKLKEMFGTEEGMTAETTRFKLDIDMENTVDYEGTTLYPIAFQEALQNLTRTKKTVETTEETTPETEPITEEAGACPTSLIDAETEVENTVEETGTQELG